MPEVHLARAPGDAHTALLALAAAVTGAPGLSLAHACPQCGSAAHGRPVLRGVEGASVSLSRPRDPGPALVALCVGAGVGVDTEHHGAVAFAGFDAVALHPRETCADDAARTRLWVRKEALLKAHGTGLATDPRTVRLAMDGTVLAGPPATLVDLDHAGQTAAVAVTPPDPVRLVWH